MSYHTRYFAKSKYDPCAAKKQIQESVGPYTYTMFDGKFENPQKVYYDHFTRPYDADVVDADSELSGRTRRASRCPSRKYNPNCKKSANCTSTYDSSVPVVLAPEVRPIVYNNTMWTDGTGIVDPSPSNFPGVRA